MSVPFDAPLFSDNFSYGSTLRLEADGRYVLETRFKEPQVRTEDEPMQITREILDEAELRARLERVAFDLCTRR
ncbi:MAG: hypothetical protein JNK05_30505 [Myxococcales bacterium]|nr:hypothetical protein [Myxococcales bacterium]